MHKTFVQNKNYSQLNLTSYKSYESFYIEAYVVAGLALFAFLTHFLVHFLATRGHYHRSPFCPITIDSIDTFAHHYRQYRYFHPSLSKFRFFPPGGATSRRHFTSHYRQQLLQNGCLESKLIITTRFLRLAYGGVVRLGQVTRPRMHPSVVNRRFSCLFTKRQPNYHYCTRIPLFRPKSLVEFEEHKIEFFCHLPGYFHHGRETSRVPDF